MKIELKIIIKKWQEMERNMLRQELSRQKKETRSFSAGIGGVTIPKSFLLLVDGTMRPSLDEALVNISTSSSRLFHQWPSTKNTKSKLQLRHHIKDLTTTTENTE